VKCSPWLLGRVGQQLKMTDSNLITIAMPVFNSERHIRQAIDSILAQEYDHLELVISDNASTDSTPDICRK
jgi:glycosyltransferase involved in cell wall biosynthesis